MNAEATTKTTWQRVVRRALLPDRTKLLLAALAEEMDHSGRAQVTHRSLVEMLGWTHDRSISRHLGYAFDGGFLLREAGGYRGFTSIYQATLPTEKHANSTPTARQFPDALPPVVGDLSERGKHANNTPLLATSIEKGERSERVAVDRSAPPEPAKTKSGEDEKQFPSGSSPRSRSRADHAGQDERPVAPEPVSELVRAARASWGISA